MMNRYFLVAVLFALLSVACRKSFDFERKDLLPPTYTSKIKYKTLGDVQVPFNKSYACDVDGDGIRDFVINTDLIGNPFEKIDCRSYFFIGEFFTYSPVDGNEETPLLNTGDVIGEKSYINHNWYNASHLLLIEKVITMSGNDFWRGKWKEASHQYLAFAIKKNEKKHYAWLELSFDQNSGAIILHRAAVAEEAEKNILAGK
ncbi:hypothetical protein [Pedobacter montanisoli]|uniref:VCBS repeat-containing protein n=1 Tax=Pedobacter montanisoli TaxID=2923277 RepID=A0ABS9ZYR4_9SPHI|nr:hypothetical protein [Pedobacter montanisoli]MCJ0743469.1 hypothetical protein [Pedobacter montanisoli]